jgi:hypothetical protein
MKLRSSLGALGICGDSSEQTIAIRQCSICRARRSGVPVRGESAGRYDDHPLRSELYQSNRTDSSLIPLPSPRMFRRFRSGWTRAQTDPPGLVVAARGYLRAEFPRATGPAIAALVHLRTVSRVMEAGRAPHDVARGLHTDAARPRAAARAIEATVLADDLARRQRPAGCVTGRLDKRNVPPESEESNHQGSRPDGNAPASPATDCLRDAVEAVNLH